jgi:hypothetical protein
VEGWDSEAWRDGRRNVEGWIARRGDMVSVAWKHEKRGLEVWLSDAWQHAEGTKKAPEEAWGPFRCYG